MAKFELYYRFLFNIKDYEKAMQWRKEAKKKNGNLKLQLT